MLEICETYFWKETLRDRRDSHFFSVITNSVVDTSKGRVPTMLVKFVNESYNLREDFVGFLPHAANVNMLAVKFHTSITEKWGLYGVFIVYIEFSSKMKVVVSGL